MATDDTSIPDHSLDLASILSSIPTDLAKPAAVVKTTADVQAGLNALGYGPLAVDNKAGPLTGAAVRSYQGNKGLPVTGIADAKTMTQLAADLTSLSTTFVRPTPATVAAAAQAAQAPLAAAIKAAQAPPAAAAAAPAPAVQAAMTHAAAASPAVASSAAKSTAVKVGLGALALAALGAVVAKVRRKAKVA